MANCAKNVEMCSKSLKNDISKLLIISKCGKVGGKRLYDILREECKIQPEMAGINHVVLLSSVMDDEDVFERLISRLKKLDESEYFDNLEAVSDEDEKPCIYKLFPRRAMRISDACERETSSIPLREMVGRVCAEMISLYPPGIPLAAPGEIMSEELCRELYRADKVGYSIDGLQRDTEGTLYGKIVLPYGEERERQG